MDGRGNIDRFLLICLLVSAKIPRTHADAAVPDLLHFLGYTRCSDSLPIEDNAADRLEFCTDITLVHVHICKADVIPS